MQQHSLMQNGAIWSDIIKHVYNLQYNLKQIATDITNRGKNIRDWGVWDKTRHNSEDKLV